jgi:hypothetical protein
MDVCMADDSRALLRERNPPGALPVGLGSPPRPGNPREGALSGGAEGVIHHHPVHEPGEVLGIGAQLPALHGG